MVCYSLKNLVKIKVLFYGVSLHVGPALRTPFPASASTAMQISITAGYIYRLEQCSEVIYNYLLKEATTNNIIWGFGNYKWRMCISYIPVYMV